MPNIGGFWAYVHADDDAEGGRIAQLARDVGAQFEAITAEPLEVFLDRDALAWGDDWGAAIDESLASIAFFLPVVTPRYFRSPECRRELQTFVHRATALGVRELVLPLVYFDVPQLNEPTPADDAVALVKTYQWEDWRQLRFEDRTSRDYRLHVARLAQRLADIDQALSTSPALSAPSSTAVTETDTAPLSTEADAAEAEEQDDDEPLGDLDLMAVAEETLPRWNVVVVSVSELLNRITGLAGDATTDMQRADQMGKGFAGRLVVAKRLAVDLKPVATQMLELGNDFTAHMYAIDPGIRAMIRAGVVAADDPAQRQEVCEFLNSVHSMSLAAAGGLRTLQSMVDSITPLESLSRELRPVLKQLRQGLTMMIEGQSVTDEWARIIESSGIDCAPTG